MNINFNSLNLREAILDSEESKKASNTELESKKKNKKKKEAQEKRRKAKFDRQKGQNFLWDFQSEIWNDQLGEGNYDKIKKSFPWRNGYDVDGKPISEKDKEFFESHDGYRNYLEIEKSIKESVLEFITVQLRLYHIQKTCNNIEEVQKEYKELPNVVDSGKVFFINKLL